MNVHQPVRILLLATLIVAVSALRTTPAATIDMLLVRQQHQDVLIVRPWLNDPPQSGLWLWPVPAGTTVAIAPDIGTDALRSAVWLGHTPLTRPNAQRLQTFCAMIDRNDVKPLSTLALGTFDSLDALADAAARERLPMTADQRHRCAEILAAGAHVAAAAWRDTISSQAGRSSPDATPLVALSLTVPGHLDTVPIRDGTQHGDCVSQLIAIGRRPLVPGPGDREFWESSLLIGRAAAPPLAAARSAGNPDVDTTWAVTTFAMDQCDDQTGLSLVPLEPLRDLRGPTARVAASWCGSVMDTRHRDALRHVLERPTDQPTSFETAFAIWALAQHRHGDDLAVLEAWADHPDPLIRSEALLNLAALDSTRAVERDLDILAAFTTPCDESQNVVDLVGSRIARSDLRDHVERLRAIADDGGGWLEWRFAEQIAGSTIGRTRRVTRRSSDQLTAGCWAVAALAARADSDALSNISQALSETATLRVASLSVRRRGGTFGHGFSSDFWNAPLILVPATSAQAWPTLHQIEVALAEQPRVRDGILRMAMRSGRVPDIAATVLMASLRTWYAQDEHEAVAILESPLCSCQYTQVRLPRLGELGTTVEVNLPLAVVGAAYVLAQRGATAPVLAKLERVQDPALRNELVFALTLSPEADAEVAAVIAAWSEGVQRLTPDDPGWAHAVQTQERIDHFAGATRRSRSNHMTPRFATDFRTRWQR